MELLNKLTMKNLGLNKKRSIVTVIGIMLSVALITAVSTMAMSFRESMIKFEKETSGNYHYEFDNVSKEDINIFENNKYIEQYFLTKQIGYAKLNDSKNENKPYVYVMEMNKSALENVGLTLKEGRFPEKNDEIVIPSHLKTNGRVILNVGETITLDVGTRVKDGDELTQYNPYSEEESSEEIINTQVKTYKIVGIIERPSLENFSAPGYTFIAYMDSNTDGIYNVYARYTARGLRMQYKVTANIVGVDEEIFSKVMNGEYTSNNQYYEKVAKEMEKARFGVKTNSVLIELESLSLEEGTVRTVFILALIIIIIIIVTSVFCIKNSFNISITEKIKQYGMLASVGATSKQIKKNVHYEAFLLGLVGIPFGVACGIIAAYILIKITNVLLGAAFVIKGFLVFKVSVVAIFSAVILSIITIRLSARKGAKIASKISPINAIRNSDDIKIKSKKLKTPQIIKLLFGIGGVISYKNMKRNKKKYRTTVVSIIVCVSVYVALSYFVNTSFKLLKVETGDYTYNISVQAYSDDKKYNEEKVKEILALNGIKRASVVRKVYATTEKVTMTDDYIKYHEVPKTLDLTLSIISLGNDEYNRYLKELNLDYDKTKDKAILINNCVSEIYDEKEYKKVIYNIIECEAGDTIKSYTDENGEKSKEYTFEIAKVTDKRPMGFENNYGQVYLVISDEKMEQMEYLSYIGCYIDAENPDGLQDKIYQVYETKEDGEYSTEDYGIQNIAETVKQINSLCVLFSIFLYGFIIVIALIGITNIFNTITTNMELRARELATLRSVGMTSKEFNKMVFSESFFYCFKSLLIGLPIGIALSYGIYKVFTNEIIIEYTLPWKGIIVSISVVFILIFTLMKYSVNKINKKNIIDTIRNENI